MAAISHYWWEWQWAQLFWRAIWQWPLKLQVHIDLITQKLKLFMATPGKKNTTVSKEVCAEVVT